MSSPYAPKLGACCKEGASWQNGGGDEAGASLRNLLGKVLCLPLA